MWNASAGPSIADPVGLQIPDDQPLSQPCRSLRPYACCVQITVRLFAGLRELAGTGHRELELPEGSSLVDVWPALGLETSRRACSTP